MLLADHLAAREAAPAIVPGDCRRLAQVQPSALADMLASNGIVLDLGVMKARVRSSLKQLAGPLRMVYGAYPLLEEAGFTDVDVDLIRYPGMRSPFRPSLQFLADGLDPFGPLPRELHLPQLEWGINWCFASLVNQYLLLHAGTLEINGRGLLLIGEPGSGKSTLTAALTLSGARCLSDEFGVVRPGDHRLLPFPKPIALKNRSIDLIRARSPEAVLGPTFYKTHKGDVAHLAIPRASVDARRTPAVPHVVVFPKWHDNSPATIEAVGQAEAFNLIAYNSFNFATAAEEGFGSVEWLVRNCACYRMKFGRLDEALSVLKRLCG